MRTSALLIILLGSLTVVMASCGRNAALQPSPPIEAPIPAGIVYAHYTEQGTEILWRKPMALDEVVLYASSSWGIIPDELGYLPSPDGKWLLVWDTEESYSHQDGDQSTTRWLVIRLTDGKQLEIGKVPGKAWLLPYWQDSGHIALMGEIEEKTVFDVETEQLCRPLPQGGRRESDAAASKASENRLVSYCQDYHPKDWKYLQLAISGLEKQLELSDYYSHLFVAKEPREYLILRTLGIPSCGLLQPQCGGRHFKAPRVAFSPDYSVIARSYAWQSEPAKQRSGSVAREKAIGSGVHLEIFEVGSGKRVWSIGFASKPRVLPKGWPFINPPPLPFTTPEIWDTRFSADGRYLSFTTSDEDVGSGYIVRIVDTANWQEVLRLSDATNAFVIPMPKQNQ
ncbi:MAG: hypothetical protein GTO55_09820 [Armatimonadetes bacterium]|nr:hypothetical protein [Armatimonadota bacterium]NIM24541.1 hypothetical protein [Armatimonadota bacterium]NIM68415.1 hypothetical protein [Armatimonadota bacterium]NIM76801.1 hypothetical protein [Armatimonadota bacterium]NIN06614.1 hypothetical protein [Armatimonadota bacterium]